MQLSPAVSVVVILLAALGASIVLVFLASAFRTLRNSLSLRNGQGPLSLDEAKELWGACLLTSNISFGAALSLLWIVGNHLRQWEIGVCGGVIGVVLGLVIRKRGEARLLDSKRCGGCSKDDVYWG